MADLPAECKGHGNLLLLCVGGHDGLAGVAAALRGESGHERSDARRNRSDIQRLADHAGGGYSHILSRDVQAL